MGRTRVLVTGGAGFIGSNIVDGLLENGSYDVRVLDNFSTGRRENLQHCWNDIELIEGDIRDLETVEDAVEGIDCILHQAALPSVPRSIKAPVTTNDVNVTGTLHLLTAAHKAGVRRLVSASSSSIYGDSEQLPKHEGMSPNPKSPYAVSKLAGESYVRVFANIYGLETISLRYFNVFGPRQDPTSQYSGVIAKYTTAALEGQPYSVFGDGLQARDFTYVDNVVQANLKALNAKHLSGGAVNIACGSMTSLLELIEILAELTDSQPSITHHEPRLGDVKYSMAEIKKAREEIGYSPTVQFREGMRRTLDWYATQGTAGDGRPDPMA